MQPRFRGALFRAWRFNSGAGNRFLRRELAIIPLSLKPMEAEPIDELPRGVNWLYEPKYDGFRCIAFRDGDKIDLQRRNRDGRLNFVGGSRVYRDAEQIHDLLEPLKGSGGFVW